MLRPVPLELLELFSGLTGDLFQADEETSFVGAVVMPMTTSYRLDHNVWDVWRAYLPSEQMRLSADSGLRLGLPPL